MTDAPRACGHPWGPAKAALACLVLLLFALAGCGGGRQIPTAYHQREDNLARKAKAAYDKGRYPQALALFTQALQASRAVEDVDLTAIHLVNIAAVYRRLGQPEKALRTADEVLETTHVAYSPSRKAGAALVKALVYRDEGGLDTAGAWADQALALCTSAPDCRLGGRIYTVKGRIALLEGQAAAAVEAGQTALSLSRGQEDFAQTASALRLLAEAKTTLKVYPEARAHYQEALALDKQLGLSRALALDLMGLGRLSLAQDRRDEALSFFRRALSVSTGGEDPQGVRAAQEMIDRLEPDK